MFFKKNKEKAQRKKLRDQIKSIRVDTFTKALVAFITLVSLIDLQLSYILAFMDKMAIAEDLSKHICTTILGVAFVYMIRAYFDTKAEKNFEAKMVEESTASKVSGVLSDAGINVDAVKGIFNNNSEEEDIELNNNESESVIIDEEAEG